MEFYTDHGCYQDMNILFISRWFPYPADNGSKIRTFNLIKQLASTHEVHLISFAPGAISAEQRSVMKHCSRQKLSCTPVSTSPPKING
jgi:hypothetical protein